MRQSLFPHLFKAGLLVLISSVVACSDPKDPSEKNFEKAINEAIGETTACFNDKVVGGTASSLFGRPYFKFPLSLEPNPVTGRSFKDEEAMGHLNSFVDAGLLTLSEGIVEQKNSWGRTKQVSVPVYDLTDLGRESYRGDGSFCYGIAVVQEITNFTIPATMGPQQMVTVKYTYSIEDLVDWTDHDYFSTIRDNAEASEDAPINDTMILVLTNNGWVPYSLSLMGL
jgi:hypothetical protein